MQPGECRARGCTVQHGCPVVEDDISGILSNVRSAQSRGLDFLEAVIGADGAWSSALNQRIRSGGFDVSVWVWAKW